MCSRMRAGLPAEEPVHGARQFGELGAGGRVGCEFEQGESGGDRFGDGDALPDGREHFFAEFFEGFGETASQVGVAGTREGTRRMRGFLERRWARARSASASESFNANRSSGEAPQGKSIRSASSAAWKVVPGMPGGVSMTMRSAVLSSNRTFARRAPGSPSFTFSTVRESKPSPCIAQAVRLCCGSASSAATRQPSSANSAARLPAMVDFPIPPLRPATAMIGIHVL